MAKEKLYKALYKNHPYSQHKYGSEASLNSISASDVINYIDKNFNRINATIAASGDINAATLAELLDKFIIDLPLVIENIKNIQDVKLEKFSENHIKINMEIPQTVIYFAQEGLDIHDKNYYPLYILNEIFGGSGLDSIIMSDLREKKGLIYGGYSSIHNYQHSNIIVTSLSTSANKAAEALIAIKGIINDMKRDGISMQKFQDTQSKLISSFIIGLDNNSSIVKLLLYMQIKNLDINFIDEHIKKIKNVTLQEVNSIIPKIYNNILFVEVGKN